MKIKLVFTSVLLIVIFVIGCRKDPDPGSLAKGPTPYSLPVKSWYPNLKLPQDNPLTEEGIQLGRMLFYDPIMSADSSISCASCHKQVFAFTDNLAVSKGINGRLLTRNSMPLHNLMWNNFFFWDGRVNTLREQVLIPIQTHNEMALDLFELIKRMNKSSRYRTEFKKAFPNQDITPENVAKALEQFLISMISFDAKIDQLATNNDTLNVISASALRGMKLFFKPVEDGGADCFHCHSNTPFFGRFSQDGSMSNNGLDEAHTDLGFGAVTGNPLDNGKFKIPNLRNVELTAPYMHDGRFATLEEVLDFYGDGSGVKMNSPNIDSDMIHNPPIVLTLQEKLDIIEFLKTLTDNNFINNPAFSNPF